MTPNQPNVSPTGRYSLSETARLLSISRVTLYKYVKIGRRYGGIDCHIAKRNKRKVFIGSDILRFWQVEA